jgi:hypothetical protein
MYNAKNTLIVTKVHKVFLNQKEAVAATPGSASALRALKTVERQNSFDA